jgi:hypothetical protein
LFFFDRSSHSLLSSVLLSCQP